MLMAAVYSGYRSVLFAGDSMHSEAALQLHLILLLVFSPSGSQSRFVVVGVWT